MTAVADKYGDWIKEGFELYKNNLAVLILSSLIAVFISGITMGILSGPMFAGMVRIVLNIRDEKQPPPTVGDVFQGFQHFLPSFLFTLVWGVIFIVCAVILGIIPCLGQLLIIALSLAATAFLMFGLYLIVDRKMDFWPASMASIDKVKSDFFPYLGLAVIASIIGEIGAIACGIGIFITLPLYFTITAIAYREVFAEGQAPPAPPMAEIKPPEPETPQAPEDPEPPEEPEEDKEE